MAKVKYAKYKNLTAAEQQEINKCGPFHEGIINAFQEALRGEPNPPAIYDYLFQLRLQWYEPDVHIRIELDAEDGMLDVIDGYSAIVNARIDPCDPDAFDQVAQAALKLYLDLKQA